MPTRAAPARRPLGNTGLSVSPVSAGSATWVKLLPGEEDLPLADHVALVHRIFESDSIRVLDTSNNYGLAPAGRRGCSPGSWRPGTSAR